MTGESLGINPRTAPTNSIDQPTRTLTHPPTNLSKPTPTTQIIDVLHPGRANVPKAELQEIIAGVR